MFVVDYVQSYTASFIILIHIYVSLGALFSHIVISAFVTPNTQFAPYVLI